MTKRPSLKTSLAAVAGAAHAHRRFDADFGSERGFIEGESRGASLLREAPQGPPSAITEDESSRSVPRSRRGKTMIAGYFSPELARAVKILAVERGVSVQAVIGEGLDLVLRGYGKHPFGER